MQELLKPPGEESTDLFRGYRHPHITVVRRTVGINGVRELRVEISVALI